MEVNCAGSPMNLSGRLLVIVLLIGPLAGPAWGQAVTWAELQGARVEATIIYDRMIERGGQTFPSRLEQHHSIVVGQGNTFQYTNTAMATGPHGTSTAQPFGGTVTLGKAGAVTNLGGGHHVWFFERGRLTLLRTYRAGGYKIEIAFTRREDELNCTVRALSSNPLWGPAAPTLRSSARNRFRQVAKWPAANERLHLRSRNARRRSVRQSHTRCQ